MKIKKNKLKQLIYEIIDDVVGEEEETLEYQGALRFLDPNIVYLPKIREENPELWQLFGEAWEIVKNKIRSPSDVHHLIGMPRSDYYEYLGFSPEEKDLVMQAYQAGRDINSKQPLPKGLYDKSRWNPKGSLGT